MTATPSTRRSMHHSQLRALGAVNAMLTAHPRASKFAGRGEFACIQIAGHEGVSFCLAVEHAGVAAELRALPLNTWVEVVALGRDAAATVARLDAPVAPVVAPVAVAPAGVMEAVDAALMLVDALRSRLQREPTSAEASAAAAIWTARAA